MIIETKEELQLWLEQNNWVVNSAPNMLNDGHTWIEHVAQLAEVYKSKDAGDLIFIIFSDKHYGNARNYFEKNWAADNILRIESVFSTDLLHKDVSMSLKNIHKVHWSHIYKRVKEPKEATNNKDV